MMEDPTKPIASPWSASPTAKAKNAVQRSVTALLDELAPDRVLKRDQRLPGPVEQHRTPTGCVLQAAAAAVSVSWFADAGNDAVLGELRVIAWRGTVTRRGAARNPKGATIVAELVLRPIEPPADKCLWRAADGTQYDTASLSAKCLALLEEQLGNQGPPTA
jgi:hypothetical protein